MNKFDNIDELNQKIRCVSHEIRNYLSICDMYSTIIEKNIQKENITNSSIDNAINCIKKSLQIINSNLLELKSINQESPRLYDFGEILNKSVELARGYVFDKDIKIDIFVKNTAMILIEENRFMSCLVNIMKNGIEAIPSCGELSVIGEIVSNYGLIKITNNGTPIKENIKKKIFERDYTTKNTGCGLGLWMCKNYLESQNATLELIKSTSKETVFEIKLPIASGDK